MNNWPHCKKHKLELDFKGFASMGGSHSNYYYCTECKKYTEIEDSVLENKKYFNMEKNLHWK